MTTVRAEYADAHCVHVGDDLVFLGTAHRIVKLEPYTHPDGWHGQTASDDFGWTITLPPHRARCSFPPRHQPLALPA